AERTGRARVLFRIGDHVLDTDRREFRRGTELIALEPQVFDLLVFLMRNRDRVVSKDELIHSIWDGRIVSDSTLTTRLNAARRAVNDSGAEQRVIRTVQRKGVGLVGEVREDRERAPLGGDASLGPELSSVPRLSIVVLPFVNLSHEPNSYRPRSRACRGGRGKAD